MPAALAQSWDAVSSLSVQLFREVRPEFFRILSGPLARLYVDVLDALEQEAGRRSGGLDREEALGIAEQVVERGEHRPAEEADPVLHGADVRERARIVLEVLRDAGWLEEPERSDWRRVMHLDANAALLLQTGLAELRGMARSIVRHTREQLSTTTLRENLAVLFDQFAERIGRACYAQLVQARLPSRLAEARRALEELEVNPGALERMQTEVLRRTPALSPETAMARVRQRLNDLAELLDQVEPLADAIDRRTAEFARRSQARFRYLQETTGENRARVQAFFETLNRHFAGRSVRDLEGLDLEFPALRLHDPRIFGGLESLYTPRLRRAAGEIEPLGDTDPDHEDRTLAELENTLRESLTVSRANGFVASLPGGRGARMDSVALLQERVLNDEDIADLVACLLHAGSADARYRVEVPRKEADADHGEFDRALNYRVERFTLIKR